MTEGGKNEEDQQFAYPGYDVRRGVLLRGRQPPCDDVARQAGCSREDGFREEALTVEYLQSSSPE